MEHPFTIKRVGFNSLDFGPKERDGQLADRSPRTDIIFDIRKGPHGQVRTQM